MTYKNHSNVGILQPSRESKGFAGRTRIPVMTVADLGSWTCSRPLLYTVLVISQHTLSDVASFQVLLLSLALSNYPILYFLPHPTTAVQSVDNIYLPNSRWRQENEKIFSCQSLTKETEQTDPFSFSAHGMISEFILHLLLLFPITYLFIQFHIGGLYVQWDSLICDLGITVFSCFVH